MFGRRSLLLFIASSVMRVVSSSPEDLEKEFLEWKQKHGKVYYSEVDSDSRFGVWKSNRKKILAHNAQADDGHHTYRMGLNALADLTVEEYRSTMLRGLARSDGVVNEVATMSQSSPPSSWDWRTHGVVTDIKNQGQCGSCWAFSAVAAMEGAFNLASNGTVPEACSKYKCGPQKTPCCSFSEQELVDCVLNGKDTCDVGGDPSDGISEIAKQMGGKINTETQYPYRGQSSKGCKAKTADAVQTSIAGFIQVTQGNEKALELATFQQPVISIGIDASADSFQFYESGIYAEPKCKNGENDLDHGVAIVGYGVRTGPAPTQCDQIYDKKTCTGSKTCKWCPSLFGHHYCDTSCGGDAPSAQKLQTANSTGTPYWIVKNSWGTDWGQKGYILMSKDKNNQCGVATMAVFAKPTSQSQSTIVV